MKYAIMLKRGKKNNWVYDVEQHAEGPDVVVEMLEFDAKRKLVLLSVLIGTDYVIYLALTDSDFKSDVLAVFLIMPVMAGIVAKYSPNEVFHRFGEDTRGAVNGVLVVEFAKTIALTLDNSRTVGITIHVAVQMLNNASGVLMAEITYLTGHIGNLFITPDAGLTTILVPALSSIGDMAGII